MEYIKYKNFLAKVISRDFHIIKILSQSPETFTHLSFYITDKVSTPVEKVTNTDLKKYLENLNVNGFFLDISNLSENKESIIMELVLEQASKDNVWIEDLHDVEYKYLINSVLKSNLT